MAIRTRILVVVVALVLVALAVLDVVSYSVVRTSLISQTDSQLQSAIPRVQHYLEDGSGPAFSSSCEGLPLHSYFQVYSLDGTASGDSGFCLLSTAKGYPKTPVLSSSFFSHVPSDGPAYATASTYRVLAERWTPPTFPFGGSTVILVVGEPMAPVSSTLGNVLLLELIVSASILVAAGAAALFLVQLGLRPLEEMAGTAGEIAEGDLTRRVEETDERTEVGRLGTALNVMLGRIEKAFREKELSESRLRQFIADASHELRTPLTSIRGYAELFRNGAASTPSDLSTALGRIESESERMSGLVEDLLLLARLDQGRPLERAPVDLYAVAEDVARDARVVEPERSVSVVGSGDFVGVGDEGRLRQVFGNLVSNAIKHTSEDSPIEIVLGETEYSVRVAVIDHGPGIPPEDRAKVFDRFWRADESRQRTKGGTGLGLSIVAAVVYAHGGGVFVTETPGGGATFVVELPRAPQDEHTFADSD